MSLLEKANQLIGEFLFPMSEETTNRCTATAPVMGPNNLLLRCCFKDSAKHGKYHMAIYKSVDVAETTLYKWTDKPLGKCGMKYTDPSRDYIVCQEYEDHDGPHRWEDQKTIVSWGYQS